MFLYETEGWFFTHSSSLLMTMITLYGTNGHIMDTKTRFFKIFFIFYNLFTVCNPIFNKLSQFFDTYIYQKKLTGNSRQLFGFLFFIKFEIFCDYYSQN